eukprot:TRINITY_DN3295_c0_g1_i1.p1 TRINITY_DN3295_c0_g1~~TRINITY_DN3295_c0_g1_i1.p1  ORF type:complete len:325 (+),score=83.18 TRINITY_DN3295_c0_g1_i1:367-1341(+)
MDGDLAKFDEELQAGDREASKAKKRKAEENGKTNKLKLRGITPSAEADNEVLADPSEPRYCVCGGVSHGDMVACDNEDCPYEWFHYECVGVTKAPNTEWFCPVCSGAQSSDTYSRPLPVRPLIATQKPSAVSTAIAASGIPTAAAFVTATSDAVVTQRKRGRPSKATAAAASTDATPAARDRGVLPKAAKATVVPKAAKPTVVPKAAKPTVVPKAVKTGAAAAAAAAVKPKRGRPAKQLVADDATVTEIVTVHNDDVMTKRKRGRPPTRSVAAGDADVVTAVPVVIAAGGDEDDDRAGKRKRGRPRKGTVAPVVTTTHSRKLRS